MAPTSADLVRASLQGDLTEVRRLVDAGADVNGTDRHGMGPLLTFETSIIEFLLSRGADPDQQTNENGAPVLVGIAYMNHVACVRTLLAGGADPNLAHPETGETALHSSLSKPEGDVVAADRYCVVKLLLDAGADPNRCTTAGAATMAFWRDVRTRGETPLHRAAAFAAENTIRLLIEAGADKSLRDANGDSPRSWASWHWRPKTLIDSLADEPGE